jgi:hypothetical protein
MLHGRAFDGMSDKVVGDKRNRDTELRVFRAERIVKVTVPEDVRWSRDSLVRQNHHTAVKAPSAVHRPSFLRRPQLRPQMDNRALCQVSQKAAGGRGWMGHLCWSFICTVCFPIHAASVRRSPFPSVISDTVITFKCNRHIFNLKRSCPRNPECMNVSI